MKSYERVDCDVLAEFDAARGDSPEFWDAHWQRGNVQLALDRAARGHMGGMDFLLRRLPRPGPVLEAGCGNGNLVAALVRHGYNAVGIDNAPQIIALSRSVVPGLNLQVGNLRALPFKDGEFAAYVCLGVIEHFAEPEMVQDIFREARRTTRGVFFFSVPYFSPLLRRAFERGRLLERAPGSEFYQYYFSRRRLEALIEANGLAVVGWSHYATSIGLRRHFAPYRWLLEHAAPLRVLVRNFPRLLDGSLGRPCSHMVGAWCTEKS